MSKKAFYVLFAIVFAVGAAALGLSLSQNGQQGALNARVEEVEAQLSDQATRVAAAEEKNAALEADLLSARNALDAQAGDLTEALDRVTVLEGEKAALEEKTAAIAAQMQGVADTQAESSGTMYYVLAMMEDDADAKLTAMTKAADLGILDAQKKVAADCLEKGDKNGALNYYLMAAEQGDIEAQVKAGQLLIEKERFDEAETMLEAAAEQGSVEAQYLLGEMYTSEADAEKGAAYYRLAAENGHVDAAYRLACAALYGNGVKQDRMQAYHWMKAAADAGHAEAQYMMGSFYYYGETGASKDSVQAAEWLSKAATQGHEKAAELLAKIK